MPFPGIIKFYRSILEKSPVKLDVVLTYSRATLHDHSLNQYIPYFEVEAFFLTIPQAPEKNFLDFSGLSTWGH